MGSIDYVALAPCVVPAVGAVVALVADLVPSRPRPAVPGAVAVVAVLGAALMLLPQAAGQRRTLCTGSAGALSERCSYIADDVTIAFQLVLALASIAVVLLSLSVVGRQHLPAGEYYALLLCSLAGAMLIVAAGDFATLVVALELLTLPTFALVALRRGDRRAGEAALKYFLLSVAAVAVMLYGAALVYAAAGSLYFVDTVARLPDSPLPALATTGSVLLLVGFAFKVAAVPFHAWAPDAYQTAPLPVAAYLSTVSKGAGVAGLVVVVSRAGLPVDAWAPVVAVLAVASLVVGSCVALRQAYVMRLLAWSGISQTGYLLVPLAALSGEHTASVERLAVAATVAYLAAYVALAIGSFAVVAAASGDHGRLRVEDMRGLAYRSPVLAGALAFFLIGLAGLPPALIGLFTKVRVFEVPVVTGAVWLAVVAAVAVVIGLGYYLPWVAVLFARADDGPDVPPPETTETSRVGWPIPVPIRLAVGLALTATLVASAVPTVVLGLVRA